MKKENSRKALSMFLVALMTLAMIRFVDNTC